MDLSLTALLIVGLGLLSFMIPVQLGRRPTQRMPSTCLVRSGIACQFSNG
jgi:hypothetical protein